MTFFTKVKRIGRSLAAVTLAGSLLFGAVCSFADDFGHQIDNAKEELTEAEDNLSALRKSILDRQSALSQLSAQIASMEAEKKAKLNECQLAVNELNYLKDSIENFDNSIAEMQSDYDRLEDRFLERSRVMYQTSSDFEILQMFFQSDNVFDFIEKLDIHKKMISEDKRLMEELKQSREALEEKRQQEEILFQNKEALLEEISEAIEQLENNEVMEQANYTNLTLLLSSLEIQENAANEEVQEIAERLTDLERQQREAEEAARRAEEERKRKEEEARRAAEEAERRRLEEEARRAEEARKAAEAEARRIEEEKKKAQESSNQGITPGQANFCWPIDNYICVTDYFHWRVHPINGSWSLHTGVDLASSMGVPILAAQSGTVNLSGENGGYGYCIIIDHGSGLQTLYGHCSKLLVSKGQHVERGQVIALVGMSGSATGPHLHFEVRQNAQPVDPFSGYIKDPR